jgi:predicted transposase/invertase (TIGR01784 family)
MRYLDPKNDLTFKRIFGEHPHLLQSFLNAVLPLPEGREIVSLEYLPAELVPEIPLFKNSIVDVRCIDTIGRQFIVEMQMLWTDSFKSRVLFNASKAYVRQIGKGVEYKGLQPVYSLSIVNQNFDLTSQEYLHHYKIIHTENSNAIMEGLEFVFIELPKFKAKQFTDKRLQVLWLRFLSEINDNQEVISQDFLENPQLKEASELILESGLTKAQLATYDKYWDTISTERTYVVDAEDRGYKQGIEQGIEQGIQQGVYLVAKKMIASGLSSSEIASITGLTIEQIEALK